MENTMKIRMRTGGYPPFLETQICWFPPFINLSGPQTASLGIPNTQRVSVLQFDQSSRISADISDMYPEIYFPDPCVEDLYHDLPTYLGHFDGVGIDYCMEHLGLDVALFRFFLVAWPRKGRVSEHDGWGQVTKFVQIKMKDRWGQHGQHGQHVNICQPPRCFHSCSPSS